MKKFIKRKNIKIFKTLDENNLGSIARTVLSSFIIFFIFYTLPIIINFTNNKILKTQEFRNNSKTILVYTLDKKNGIVYVTTGNPQPSLYGVNRLGSNHRSASLIAVDLKKKEILWDFQETFHDLWDFDIPTPPIVPDERRAQW